MNTPRIELYMNEMSGISIAHVKGTRDPLIIDLPIGDLIAAGEDDAALKIGKSLLAILKLWHPDALKNVATQAPISRAEIKASIAQELIGVSVSERTAWYIDTIDKLLTESSIELGDDFLVETWPPIRERLATFRS